MQVGRYSRGQVVRRQAEALQVGLPISAVAFPPCRLPATPVAPAAAAAATASPPPSCRCLPRRLRRCPLPL